MDPDPPRGSSPARPRPGSPESLPSIADTVLVVEDEASVRILIMGVLQGAGFKVLGARDGEDALHLLETHPRTIHLLITDFTMPKMTGGTLIRRVAQQWPRMKVLCITGHPADAAGLPHVALLEKPFTLKTILDKVHELLDAPEGRR